MLIFFISLSVVLYFGIVVFIIIKLNIFETRINELIKKFDEMDKIDEYFIATGLSNNDLSK